MSPILRRENEYDPRKRRAAWWNELAEAQRDSETDETDPPPIPEQSTLVDSPGKGITRHRSYGSDQGSVASDAEEMQVHVVVETSPYLKRNILHQALTLAIQSTPSLLLSLVGVIFTGQLLDHLAVWSVFRRVDEMFILVPVLVSASRPLKNPTDIPTGQPQRKPRNVPRRTTRHIRTSLLPYTPNAPLTPHRPTEDTLTPSPTAAESSPTLSPTSSSRHSSSPPSQASSPSSSDWL